MKNTATAIDETIAQKFRALVEAKLVIEANVSDIATLVMFAPTRKRGQFIAIMAELGLEKIAELITKMRLQGQGNMNQFWQDAVAQNSDFAASACKVLQLGTGADIASEIWNHDKGIIAEMIRGIKV